MSLKKGIYNTSQHSAIHMHIHTLAKEATRQGAQGHLYTKKAGARKRFHKSIRRVYNHLWVFASPHGF